ncbi:hypothetical protein [Nocardia xishanensis]|uniref:hypothetical protein n=1 Tax=Nocardia xishanensis TaxID=238964 RepID=UPI000AD1DC23|nr:hypothetical protein [Nocardia xishanensis]
MNTNKIRTVGRARLILGLAAVGAAMTVPVVAAAPATAAPASSPGVVQTEFPPCERGFMCNSDRDYDGCDRGNNWWGGGNNWWGGGGGYGGGGGGGYGGYGGGGYGRSDRGYDECGGNQGWGGSSNFFPFGLFGSS